jgi:hypothetical protein
MLPGKNDTYRLLAAAPAQKGIASLRYDKRGIAASAGAMVAEQDLRFEMYVNGAAAWLRQLRADKRFSKAAIAGHSEGSLIGMLAAQQVPVAGYVSLVVVQGMNHVLKYAPDISSQTAILKGYENPQLPVDPHAVGAVAGAA